MYKVKKTMEISASHSLHFSKAGADEPMHGHNWTVTVWCRGRELDEDGLLVDFLDIEKRIHDYLDHGNLNDLLPFNPGAPLLPGGREGMRRQRSQLRDRQVIATNL